MLKEAFLRQKVTTGWTQLRQVPIKDMQEDETANSHAYSMFFNLNRLLVDIYITSRMLKQPTAGDPCKLALGFFGNYHVLSIQTLLSKVGYKIEASIPATYIDQKEKGDSQTRVRCLSINKRIDLKKLLLTKAVPRKRCFGEYKEELSKKIKDLTQTSAGQEKKFINSKYKRGKFV